MIGGDRGVDCASPLGQAVVGASREDNVMVGLAAQFVSRETSTMDAWPEGLHPGRLLSNPVTGQTLTFLEFSPELLLMETTYRAGGPQAPEHYHPRQEEHFVVLEGARLVSSSTVQYADWQPVRS